MDGEGAGAAPAGAPRCVRERRRGAATAGAIATTPTADGGAGTRRRSEPMRPRAHDKRNERKGGGGGGPLPLGGGVRLPRRTPVPRPVPAARELRDDRRPTGRPRVLRRDPRRDRGRREERRRGQLGGGQVRERIARAEGSGSAQRLPVCWGEHDGDGGHGVERKGRRGEIGDQRQGPITGGCQFIGARWQEEVWHEEGRGCNAPRGERGKT
mmetsp:Transcript_13725/g.29843  ORF Transcript_13725/g.29843 Transcript_13725/m.29843 type:complete len:212 (-) Transcript_13725:348-983(-)